MEFLASFYGSFFFIFLFNTIRSYNKFKKIEKTSVTRIKDIGYGYHIVKGKVIFPSGNSETTPISEKASAYWKLSMMVPRRSSNPPRLRQITIKVSADRIHIDDGTGMLPIDPDRGKIVLKRSINEYSYRPFGRDREFDQVLEKVKQISNTELTRAVKIIEEFVPSGEEVYAGGRTSHIKEFHLDDNDPYIKPITFFEDQILTDDRGSISSAAKKRVREWFIYASITVAFVSLLTFFFLLFAI